MKTILLMLMISASFSLCSCESPLTTPKSAALPSGGMARVGTTSLRAPFFGEVGTNGSATKWYDYLGSTSHIAFPTFSDTKAIDFNLSGDREKNLPATSPISGTVIKMGNTFPGTASGGEYGALFIYGGKTTDNTNTSIAVGFMHLANIKVKEGYIVKEGQEVGEISNTYPGTLPIHLHVSYYLKAPKGIWESQPVSYADRPFPLSLSLVTPADLVVGTTAQLTADVPFGRKGKINEATYASNTLWSSDDASIASVDGNGKVTAKKVGTIPIRLKFSGMEFSYVAKVVAKATPFLRLPFTDLINANTLNFGSLAGSFSFPIESNEPWTVSSDNPAFTLTPLSGKGNQTVTVNYPANATNSKKQTRITVKSPTFTKSFLVLQEAAPLLTVPTGVRVTALSATSVRVSWNGVSGAAGYKVVACGTSNFSMVRSTSTTADILNLKPNQTVSVTVQAYNAAYNSPYSDCLSGKTLAN